MDSMVTHKTCFSFHITSNSLNVHLPIYQLAGQLLHNKCRTVIIFDWNSQSLALQGYVASYCYHVILWKHAFSGDYALAQGDSCSTKLQLDDTQVVEPTVLSKASDKSIRVTYGKHNRVQSLTAGCWTKLSHQDPHLHTMQLWMLPFLNGAFLWICLQISRTQVKCMNLIKSSKKK